MPQARVRHAGLGCDSSGGGAHRLRRRPARCSSRCRSTPRAAAASAGAALRAADAGLGQHELDAARGLPVAGERGDDRADLLVAGAQQERRRAAVALHADHVDAGVGVRELVDAVRRHADPQECRLGSISGASARAASTRSSRSSRSSPSSARSGRKPVAAITSSATISRSPSARTSRVAGASRPRASGSRPPARPSRPRRARGPPRRARRGPAAGRRRRRRTCGPGAPPRIAHTIWVAGSESRSATRSRIALNAEWPLPTTSTRLPA